MTSTPAHDGAGSARVGRSYTRARRFPWVVGKIQGWQIPFGPYTATQLGVLIAGIWLLVQTFSLWSRLGALGLVFVAAPPAATWAVRHAKIDGRTPIRALGGYVALLLEPAGGRIGGRQASSPRPTLMTGKVRLDAPPRTQAATGITTEGRPTRSAQRGAARPPAAQTAVRHASSADSGSADSGSLPPRARTGTARPTGPSRLAVAADGNPGEDTGSTDAAARRPAPAPTGLQTLLSAVEKTPER